MIRCVVLGVLSAGLMAFTGSASLAADPLQVYSVNYPLAYFAERIAGEHAEVEFPAPPAVDPAFWQPAAELIGEYQRADLILLNGAGYAKWIDKSSLPRSRLVNTSKAFADGYLAVEGVQTHSHGGDGEHSHSGTAWTTWLDFQQAAMQARAIAEALKLRRPKLEDSFERNYQALDQDLMALDEQLRELSDSEPELPFLASHPVYQYLARRYGLDLESVQWEPEEFPDDAQWKALEVLLEAHPGRWMIWEGAPDPKTVERLQALGVASLVFDPAANRPEQGDFLTVMGDNVSNLSAAYTSDSQ